MIAAPTGFPAAAPAPLPARRRDPNLDLLRAAAIIVVIAAHLPVLAPVRQPALLHATWAGQFGVDLFFVLSGWLISGIYYRERTASTHPSWARFVGRRALRTLPPYYVALGIAWFAARTQRADHPAFEWPYLVFLQNYLGTLPFFAVSWSLCIEEHFYLVLPAALARWRLSSRATGYALLAGIVFSPLCRTCFYSSPSIDVFDPSVYGTHVHLDGLMLGVAARWLQVYRPDAWARTRALCRQSAWAAALGLAAVYIIPPRWFYCVGYTYVSALLGILLAACVGGPALPAASWRLTRAVAAGSYSIYLTHALALHVARILAARIASASGPGAKLFCYYAFALAGMALAGVGFNRLIEQTASRWRDRLMPAPA